jgi:leucyl-tRNA synthetase
MSKSKGNVINPDVIVKEYGADTLRLYEMFMGPFEQMIPWDTKGVVGCRRLIEKVWKLSEKIQTQNANSSNLELKKILHKTIKKVSEDVESMKFNTAVSSIMEFANAWQTSKEPLDKKDFSDFLKILSPFAPHLAEELWEKLAHKDMCCQQKWPKADEKIMQEKNVILIVQVNGKVRDKIEAKTGISQKEAEKIILQSEKIKALIGESEIKRFIFIPDKLINIVI